ncbi:hypothetical protein BCR34DRAFT_486992, partial [Clohesyomyces aquaticus]
KLVDYVLSLPALLGAYSGSNVTLILDSKVTRLGYFILDNATNNNSAVIELA